MTDGKNCPVCQRDIGIWPVFAAGLPNRIRCPHCSARLTYSRLLGVLLVLLVALAVTGAGSWYAAAAIPGLHPNQHKLAAVGIMLGLWVLIELAAAQFLRNKRVLVQPGSQVQSPDDSW
jgi:hypothetical protein